MAEKMISKFKKILKNVFGATKKSKIRFYTLEPPVLSLFPIVPSMTYKRNYLNFPPPPDKNIHAVQTCPGILKLTSAGWIVPAPADFVIKTDNTRIAFEWREPWRFKSGDHPDVAKYISIHGPAQAIPLLDDRDKTVNSIVKVETPWRVSASDDVILLILPVSYNNESRFSAAPGFLDPAYAYNINIQLFWNVLEGEELVRAGTPLCQIIPMQKKDLTISAFDVTIDEANIKDVEKEKAFLYAANCVILGHDKLSSRLRRSTKILNKYK
jgi:hypothetical protein